MLQYSSMLFFFSFVKHTHIYRVIWLNIVKFRVYLHYRHCSNLFREIRKESEFEQQQQKYEREREKVERENLNFGNVIAEILAAQTSYSCSKKKRNRGRKKKLWQLWQCHCRKWEGGKIVVAEIWGGIKKKKCYVHNIFTTNYR